MRSCELRGGAAFQRRRALRRSGRAAVWLLALVAAGLVAYASTMRAYRGTGGKDFGEPGAARGHNVVLITVDSLRADALGCYGDAKAKTPVMDALAAKGVRIAEAVTSVPMTLPAHATLFTSQEPPRHGVRDDGMFPLAARFVTLAETLRGSGYATAAFVGSFLLDRRFGLDQGFDLYDDDMTGGRTSNAALYPVPERNATAVVDRALAWLNVRSQEKTGFPYFLWVHLYDAASVFPPPEKFAADFPKDTYRAKVAFVDEQIGRLKAAVDASSPQRGTLIIVAGSHGEGNWAHGEEHHGMLLHEAAVAVPLIIHDPQSLGRTGVLDNRVAGLIDLTPTIIDFVGARPLPHADGESLLAAARPERSIYLETVAPLLRHRWAPQYGLRRTGQKLMLLPDSAFFDLRTDPGETQNLWASAPAAQDLYSELQRRLQGAPPIGYGRPGDEELFGPTLRTLANQLGGEVPPVLGASAVAPVSMMETYRQYPIAEVFLAAGRFEEAVAISEQLMGGSQSDPWVWASLAQAYVYLEQWRKAEEAALRAVGLQPRARHWLPLARALRQLGKEESAELCLDRLAVLDSQDGGVELARGEKALAEGNHEAALQHAERARAVDPYRHAADSFALTGDVYLAKGDLSSSRGAYLRALEVDPAHVAALQGLAGLEQRAGNLKGQAEYMAKLVQRRPYTLVYVNTLARLYVQMNQTDKAAAVLQDYSKRMPEDVAAIGNLGNVYFESSQVGNAIREYRRALDLDPNYVYARYNLAASLAIDGDPDEAIAEYHRVREAQPKHVGTVTRIIRILVEHDRIDEALAELEQAASDGAVDWDTLSHDELYAPLAGDPRFAQLREKHLEGKGQEGETPDRP